MNDTVFEIRPAGYAYLVEKMDVSNIPYWRRSYIVTKGVRRTEFKSDIMCEYFPSQYWPGDGIEHHLEFALKYDGIHLSLLKCLFDKMDSAFLARYIEFKPTGKYSRRLWFFYEFLTGKRLPLSDLSFGNYVNALDPDHYYTVTPAENSTRHRVANNLLGPAYFCPIVRKTSKLSEFESVDLLKKIQGIVSDYPTELLSRALRYLYHKETKSSFEIERITPNSSRVEAFIASLTLAEKEDFCKKNQLISLQNQIVDTRFKAKDYRDSQNYVGQTISPQNEVIHFICPKPEDLPGLMDGLLDAHQRMKKGNVSPVIHAAIIAYGFVFLHPFDDGNGRIHRFLIHNILSIQGVTPPGFIFPISAVMLKKISDYDASLEAFSKPLLRLIDYRLDDQGVMSIKQDTGLWYRYMDLTVQAEALSMFVMHTIESEFAKELQFLEHYDVAKREIQQVVDMPDSLIDLFIRLCLQNKSQLSSKKRGSHFHFLKDEEVSKMESIIQTRLSKRDDK